MHYKSRCYMCIQWTSVLYSAVITRQSNPPISQFSRSCNEFTSAWSMFVYNTGLLKSVFILVLFKGFITLVYLQCIARVLSRLWAFSSNLHREIFKGRRGAVGSTHNVEVVGSSPIKGPRCFLEQETLPLLLSAGWFQASIRG